MSEAKKETFLYRCPVCGKVDTDDQDGDGHWEHGTSVAHIDDPDWSYWHLQCSQCGEINDMQRVN